MRCAGITYNVPHLTTTLATRAACHARIALRTLIRGVGTVEERIAPAHRLALPLE